MTSFRIVEERQRFYRDILIKLKRKPDILVFCVEGYSNFKGGRIIDLSNFSIFESLPSLLGNGGKFCRITANDFM